MARLARHSLAWLSEEGWREAAGGLPELDRDAAEQWRRNGWPAIVRRHDADAAGDQACLGIALPPDRTSGVKRRIGIRVRSACIERLLDPPALARIVPVVPSPWRQSLAALDSLATDAGIRFLAYGSSALQCLTGQPYMTENSDIDLLLHPQSPAQLAGGLALLSSFAETLPLDGEIVFPSGQAVAWREWVNAEKAGNADNACRVLVKDMHAVRLMKTNELLATLETQPCMQ